MFTEQEFKLDKELWDQIVKLKASDEKHYSKLLETSFLAELKQESIDEFILQMIVYYRGLVFTNSEELTNKLAKLLNHTRAIKWMIPLSELSERLAIISRAINGQILRGYILSQIYYYLEIKIALEIIDWGGKTIKHHNGVSEVNKLVKIIDNIYRRKDYANGEIIHPLNIFDAHMIEVTNEFDSKTGNSDAAKRFLLKGLHGNIEKCFALLIIEGIKKPVDIKMSEKEFHSLLFDLFYLIFKDIGWSSSKVFEKSLVEYEEFHSYERKGFMKPYRLYKARQVKSLLKPTRDIS